MTGATAPAVADRRVIRASPGGASKQECESHGAEAATPVLGSLRSRRPWWQIRQATPVCVSHGTLVLLIGGLGRRAKNQTVRFPSGQNLAIQRHARRPQPAGAPRSAQLPMSGISRFQSRSSDRAWSGYRAATFVETRRACKCCNHHVPKVSHSLIGPIGKATNAMLPVAEMAEYRIESPE